VIRFGDPSFIFATNLHQALGTRVTGHVQDHVILACMELTVRIVYTYATRKLFFPLFFSRNSLIDALFITSQIFTGKWALDLESTPGVFVAGLIVNSTNNILYATISFFFFILFLFSQKVGE
jgi:hypothetical protein